MRNPTRLGRLAATLSAVALSAASARADQQYDLQFRAAPDQVWSFAQATTMSMQGTAGGQPFQQAGGQKRGGTVTVLTVKDGVPTAIQVAFADDCAQSAGNNGQTEDKPFPLAGKTVRLKKDDAGVLVVDGADVDQPTSAELAQMLTPDRSLFPKAPVAVGDDWAGDSAPLLKQIGWGPNDTISIRCKLDRIGSVRGRPTADIAVTITGTGTQNGITTKLSMNGTVHADLATGQTLQADLTGKMDMAGQANTPQGPAPVQGDGKLEVHQTARPVAGVDAPATRNPITGGVGPAPAVQSQTEVTPNPLGAAAPSDKFAGTFKNDTVSVRLEATGNGSYTGAIVMGDRKFPASAKADGDQLVGTFTSGSTAFKFTATVDGPTLQLSSGQNNFTLQKDAPNPLDAAGGAAPANPLGR